MARPSCKGSVVDGVVNIRHVRGHSADGNSNKLEFGSIRRLQFHGPFRSSALNGWRAPWSGVVSLHGQGLEWWRGLTPMVWSGVEWSGVVDGHSIELHGVPKEDVAKPNQA
jgi:hypothetical protein